MNKPIISLVAAMSKNHVIGRDNDLPWHLPKDFAHFKRLTTEKPMIMGRKTFDSLGGPLPNRQNIIITRQKDFTAENCEIFHSIEEALHAYQDSPEIMIAGGARIYEQTITDADRLYITIVDAHIDGDTFFPAWPEDEWEIISEERHEPDERHEYAYTFLRLDKKFCKRS